MKTGLFYASKTSTRLLLPSDISDCDLKTDQKTVIKYENIKSPRSTWNKQKRHARPTLSENKNDRLSDPAYVSHSKQWVTPRHRHDWERVNFVIRGQRRLRIGGMVFELKESNFAYIPPTPSTDSIILTANIFEFICLVPNLGAY